jgi:hypothetical protein
MQKNVRSIFIMVRLAKTAAFEIRADERVSSTRGEAKYTQSAEGDNLEVLLDQVIQKIRQQYNRGTSISVEVDADDKIQPD